MAPPSPWKGMNSIGWSSISDGSFSLKLAYKSIIDDVTFSDELFKLVWRWRGI
ncbi:Putative ribonuclease H protein [Arachis hypogaea]|nr:Putative ribonuclease H protein [Arachis hypogaea]